ncbi:hypothetical protein TVAG_496250 [Trichomonas vaginalis G3]|uniref:Uncharacterized protein n=1 Tax=Trichomonas vaginalis (strain ATCC PRA-98 / G3) TaxID=412133 RepID=A2FR75_TRIV3|nr:ribonuclease inhibitor domain-containing protein [Trichomonas vaginalis G3]EAX92591.1 hypothetical protein TVAG_496250 [Trichomonas vaginalis G3]KAI5533834.1 ribonuclease inhibitor domain-containing protein [Trichomonas vaginalis G3]|eukprot:XP_001305521.1 hypothetical protein [Trichomonas vaginalis G3]
MKQLGSLIATRKGFTAPPQIDYSRYSETVNLSHNPINTFDSLPQLSNVQNLIFDDTKLESFLKCRLQPEIESFSCLNTPLASSKFLPLMAIIAFGENVKVVNGSKVTQKTLKEAQTYHEELYPYIVEGWVITSLSPIKVYNPITKEKKVIKQDKENQANNQIEIVFDPNDKTELEEEKSKNIAKALRYRFNDLVHPASKQKSPVKAQSSKPKGTVKSRGFASPPPSSRQINREKSQNTKVTVKAGENPFEKKQ